MATDLFFSQPVPQNPTAGIYNDKIRPSDSAHSAKIKTTGKPMKAEGESFLTTLKKAAQNAGPTEKLHNTSGANRSKTKASVLKDKTDETPDPVAAPNEEKADPAQTQENGEVAASDQLPSIRNFMDVIKALEDMGFHHLDGGSDRQNRVNADPTDGKDLASLKMLMARLQQNGRVSSSELKAAFERLQQFIAAALEGNSPAPVDGNTGSGQAMNQVPDSARIFQWIKDLISDPHHQSNDTQMSAGEGVPDAKASESTPSEARVIVEPAANSIDLTGNDKGSGSFQSADNAGVTSQTDSPGTMEPAKGATDKLPSPAQINENAKEATAVEKADADISGFKAEMDSSRETKTGKRVDTAAQMPADRGHVLQNNTNAIPDNSPLKQSASSGAKMESGSLSDSLNQATAGEETGGKVIKTEAGTNDPGLLNPQNHPEGKIVETASLPKETESDRSGLKTQTLDQIVQKAAIHLKDGQHEARIDLKPEFLGHIRMQVISENHQVTVKILTEHGFVKDMIENNLHQLKADLQQQGLGIDKLEVSVSRDSDESGNPKERLAGMRTRQGAADDGKQRHSGQDTPKDNRQPRRYMGGATTVDYFA